MHPRGCGRRSAAYGRILGVFLCLLLPTVLSVGATAGPPETPDRIEELQCAHAAALRELFLWCRGVRLNRTADAVANELLELNPDDAKARRWLGFKRVDEAWKAPKRPKVRRDWNRSAKESYAKRRAQEVDSLVDRYWALYESLSGDVSAEDRRRLLPLAIERWPDDARFRAASGEILRGERWVLRETVQWGRVHARLKKTARRLRLAAPRPQDAWPPPMLDRLDLPWKGAGRTGNVTVVSLWSREDADRVARHCRVVAELSKLVYGVTIDLPEKYTVLLGRDVRDFRTVVVGVGVPRRSRRELGGACGVWLPGLDLHIDASEDPDRRLDGTVYIAAGCVRSRAFGHFGSLGWVCEGLDTYLTYLVNGSCLTDYRSMGAPTRSETERARRDEETDWLDDARRLEAGGELPELVYVLAVNHRSMTPADRVAAYAFAVYLVTGWPGRLQRFLRAANDGHDHADAATEVFDLELPALDARFRRWLRETV